MPADYNIPMTDAQITEALQLMVERVSEGWAQGTYDGSPVGSGSPFYNKHSKYWAMQAADAAARAEAAVPAGTAGAVFFDRAQSLTAAQQEQARQNIKAGGSNPNLLDNPWFSSGFVVNQRGFSSKTITANNEYVLDRWNISLGTDSALFELTANGIRIVPNGSYANIRQPFETVRANSFIGVPLTASVMLADGTIRSGTLTWSGSQAEYFFGNPSTFSAYLGASGAFIVRCVSDTTIKAVKLELGSVSTLANDIAPNYAEELAKCQRSAVLFDATDGEKYLGIAIAVSATKYMLALPLPVPMRAKPSIAINYTITIDGVANFSAATVESICAGMVVLSFTGSGYTAGTVKRAYMNTGNKFLLSADL